MFTGKVTDSEKRYSPADNDTVIDVHLDIFDADDELVESRHFAYPISITEEEIKRDLDKFMATYNDDAERAIINNQRDKDNAEADKIVENIKGLAISGKSKNNK